MTDYFSSLIQQTGITFRPDSDYNSEALESSPIRSKELSKAIPIHVLREKVVEPQTDKLTGEVHEDVTEGFKQTDSHNDNKNIHHIEDKIIIKPQIDKSAGETNRDIKAGFEHSELYIAGNSNQYLKEDFKEKASEESYIKGYENLTSFPQSSSIKGGKVPSPFVGDGQGEGYLQVKNISTEDSTISNDQLTRERIWKTTFKEIREWVAETPDKDIAETHERDTLKTIDAKGIMGESPSLTDQRLLSPIPEPGQREKQEEKTEIQDFHLSIGTISLTIEEPQKEIQSYKPVQMRRDERPNKENSFSRLSRHYIRI